MSFPNQAIPLGNHSYPASAADCRRSSPGLSQAFIAKLDCVGRLTDGERTLLERLGQKPTHHDPRAELRLSGGRHVILSGWAAHNKFLMDGRRQIFSFAVPGDFIPSAPCGRVFAITHVVTADLKDVHEALSRRDPAFPNLASALGQIVKIDQEWLLHQVMRLGTMKATERTAHLILELHHRLGTIGMAEPDGFIMPATQEDMADALGLSIVHINRTLRELKDRRLIKVANRRVVILDRRRLESLASFHLPQPANAERDEYVAPSRWQDSGAGRAM